MTTRCVTAHHAHFLKMKIKNVYVQKGFVVVHIWAYRSGVAGWWNVIQSILQEHYVEKKEICMYIDEHNIQQSPCALLVSIIVIIS